MFRKIVKSVVILSLVSMAILLSLELKAKNYWAETDTDLQLTYLAYHGLDWLQTRYIVTNEVYYETNPILGQNPSRKSVDLYFLATGIAHTLISYNLNSRQRKWFQYFTIILETDQVKRNYNIGIGLKF